MSSLGRKVIASTSSAYNHIKDYHKIIMRKFVVPMAVFVKCGKMS